MEPIINPWIFYLMHVLNGIGAIAIIAAAVLGIYTFIRLVIVADDSSDILHSINSNINDMKDTITIVGKNGCSFSFEGKTALTSGLPAKGKEKVEELVNRLETEVNSIGKKYTDSLSESFTEYEQKLTRLEKYTAKIANPVPSWVLKAVFCLSLLVILIPCEATLKKMIAAYYITPNNVNLVKDGTKDSIDYIFEKIQKVVEAEKGNKK